MDDHDYKETAPYKYGAGLIHLGKVLQDEKSTISDITEASRKVGLILGIALVANEEPEANQ